MAICWPLQMPPPAKAVLMSLADNANDAGFCWPSLKAICDRTCFGKTAVIQAIKWLEDSGYLAANRDNGRHSTYTLNLSVCRTGASPEPVRETVKPVRLANQPVREADTNHQEPSEPRAKRIIAADLDLACWPSRPSPQVLADWLAHRKAKKAPVSQTVIEAFGRELHKAAAKGFTVDVCLSTAMQRNWQGLNADWLGDSLNARAGPGNAAPGKTMQGIQLLERMKNGLADAGNSNGIPETSVPRLGTSARR